MPILTCALQASKLRIFLIILYINKIRYCCGILSCVLYADDTTMFLSGSTSDSVDEIFNSQISVVDTKLKWIRLLTKFSKPFYLNFPRRLSRRVNTSVQFVSKSQSTKFLGVHIDERLSFDDHGVKLLNKISYSVRVMNNSSTFFPLV